MFEKLAKFRRSTKEPAAIGLGTAALGRPGYINTSHGQDLSGRNDVESMKANAWSVFDFAYEQGVRYFDAARSYGKAEEFLATWLQARNHNDLFVASKWGYTYVANWKIDVDQHEIKDHSVDAFRRQVVESKALLGEHLNLYQIHSVTPASPALQDQQLLGELATLKASGVAIGLSTSGPDQPEVLEKVSSVLVDGDPLFDSVQVTWNMLETSATQSLAKLRDQGVLIVLKEVLANGRLTSSGDQPATSPEVDAAPDALALNVALNHSPADIVLSGAVNIAQLESNLSSLQLPADIGNVAPTAVNPSDYWTYRSNLPWN